MMKFALKAVTLGIFAAGSTMAMAEDAPSFMESRQQVVWQRPQTTVSVVLPIVK